MAENRFYFINICFVLINLLSLYSIFLALYLLSSDIHNFSLLSLFISTFYTFLFIAIILFFFLVLFLCFVFSFLIFCCYFSFFLTYFYFCITSLPKCSPSVSSSSFFLLFIHFTFYCFHIRYKN